MAQINSHEYLIKRILEIKAELQADLKDIFTRMDNRAATTGPATSVQSSAQSTVHRITSQEFWDYRNKGICYRCKKPYHPVLECPRKQILVFIKNEDDLEDSEEDTEEDREIEEISIEEHDEDATSYPTSDRHADNLPIVKITSPNIQPTEIKTTFVDERVTTKTEVTRSPEATTFPQHCGHTTTPSFRPSKTKHADLIAQDLKVEEKLECKGGQLVPHNSEICKNGVRIYLSKGTRVEEANFLEGERNHILQLYSSKAPKNEFVNEASFTGDSGLHVESRAKKEARNKHMPNLPKYSLGDKAVFKGGRIVTK